MDYEKIIRFAQFLDRTPESLDELYRFILRAFGIERPPGPRAERKGKLITFDGHSGAGKDTQMEILKEYMEKDGLYAGFNIIRLVQKRNDPFRQVSKYLWANPHLIAGDKDCSLMLLTVGRRYFVEHVVSQTLENPRNIIIQNRSYLSNIAYHASDVGELPVLLNLCDFDPKPDLPFILTCDTETAFERIRIRAPEKGGKIYPNEMPDYISRVKRNFEALGYLIEDLIFIDTSGDVGPIAQQIRNHVDGYFGRGF